MGYKDPDRQREYARKWVAKRRSDFFADKSCVVCGSTEELELDHVDPRLKVSHSIWSWRRERREAEIAKCQILCRKHHVEKTLLNGEHPVGEARPNSKLTEAMVLEMRALSAAGLSQAKIGARFGVSKGTVQNAVSRKWKYLNRSA